MMFVLLFLFQFSMVIRDRQNTYDVNSNFTTRQKDGKNVWKNKQIDPVAVRTTDRSYALFVGKQMVHLCKVGYGTVQKSGGLPGE